MKKFSSTEVLAMATEHPWNDQAWDLNLTEYKAVRKTLTHWGPNPTTGNRNSFRG